MREYPIPLDEEARLATLEATGMLRRSGDTVLDHAVALARHLLDAPVALVSLVAQETQHFIAKSGLDVDCTGRDSSICAHAIMRRHALIVLDTQTDPRTSANPLVIGAPHIRFYAGAPIILSTGVRLGALCAIDFAPRSEADPAAVTALESLAAMVARHLDKLHDQKSAQARIDEALNRARREVLALVSNELRAPVAVMRGAAALDGTAAQDLRREGLIASAAHLDGLADRIASFSNAIPSGLGLDERPVLLRGLLSQCGAMASAGAASRGIAVTCDAPDDVFVHADPIHLANAVFALLCDALACASQRVALCARRGVAEELVIEISHDAVADPQTEGGSMALARSLAALHGGEAGAGATAQGLACLRIVLPAWRRVAPLAA